MGGRHCGLVWEGWPSCSPTVLLAVLVPSHLRDHSIPFRGMETGGWGTRARRRGEVPWVGWGQAATLVLWATFYWDLIYAQKSGQLHQSPL